MIFTSRQKANFYKQNTSQTQANQPLLPRGLIGKTAQYSFHPGSDYETGKELNCRPVIYDRCGWRNVAWQVKRTYQTFIAGLVNTGKNYAIKARRFFSREFYHPHSVVWLCLHWCWIPEQAASDCPREPSVSLSLCLMWSLTAARDGCWGTVSHDRRGRRGSSRTTG